MSFRDLRAYSLIRPYVPNSLRHIAHAGERFVRTKLLRNQILDFGRFRLRVNNRDLGGVAHATMYWHELSSPLDREIAQVLRPQVFLDIGANYGFWSLLHHGINPNAKFILIEANPALIPYIHANLENVGATSYEVLNAVCGDQLKTAATFSLNPSYSQDSRVTGPSTWKKVSVSSVTIDSLVASHSLMAPVLIKVDTQGFEPQVIGGAKRLLESSSNWAMKVEFGPYWLRSQGTNPCHFLESLSNTYRVCELPTRIRFKGDGLRSILSTPIAPSECAAFTQYIGGLSKDDHGYCDLLVLPRTSSLLQAP